MIIKKITTPCYPLVGITLLFYILVGYLYWPAINGGLVWDDPALISRHHLLDTKEWFHHSFGIAFLSDAYYYRPLPLITLMWNGVWGPQHFIFLSHLTNIVLFCLNLTLVIALTFRVSSSHIGSTALAGFFYSVHPALIESTAWISGRCDLLLTFFVLLAFYFDVILKNHFKSKTILVSLCFLFAALSKEAAIVFPAVLLCWKLYFENIQFTLKGVTNYLKKNNNIVYFVLIILTGFIYLAIRIAFLGSLFAHQVIPTSTDNISGSVGHLFLVMKTFSWYWLLQLFPHYDLSAIYHTNTPVTFQEHAAWYGFFLLILSFVLLLNGKVSARSKYGLVVLMILFLPIANIKPILTWDNFIHLRFLTLPISCLIIFYVPIAFDWISTQRKQLQAIIVASTVLWCLGSFANVLVTVPLWSHERFLWKWVTETKPDSYLAWDNYSAALLAEKDFENCILAAEESIKRNPKNGKAYVTGAQCSFEIKDFDKASNLIHNAMSDGIEIDPVTFSSLLTTSALLDMKNFKNNPYLGATVISGLKQAISLNETNNRARYLLIAWYIKNDSNDAARDLALSTYRQSSNPALKIEDILLFIATEEILDIVQTQTMKTLLVSVRTEKHITSR